MNKVICFGEILWDFLPKGKFIGGAPFNVAFHLKNFGDDSILVSSIGKDKLGKETLDFMKRKGFSSKFVNQSEISETGKVVVKITDLGEPIYKILENVAWDSIFVSEELLKLAKNSQGLVFGSLALRGEKNLKELEKLLALNNLTKFLDVNLRFPFSNKNLVLELVKRVEFVKLNETEITFLTDEPILENAFLKLSGITKAKICVTLGAKGAILFDKGVFYKSESPKVKVKDTVGAGDAFWASFVNSILIGEKDFDGILQKACKFGSLVASEEGAIPNILHKIKAIKW